MTGKSSEIAFYRYAEVGSILIYVVVSLFLAIIAVITYPTITTPTGYSVQLEALASAMPNQGWAPMTVYFSALGSQTSSGKIVSYEWDLDGNGLIDTDATKDGGYTSYSYAKPGEYTITLKVTDDNGRSATDSIVINVRHPASSSVDYWTMFDDSQVRRVDLIVSQENWQRMWSEPEAKLKVEADMIFSGIRLDSVGLSMKGNGSLGGSGEKKSWKIDTDEFIEGQEYKNLKQLLFHNNFMDPSMLREKMAYDMMRFAGVPAGHVAFVELWIDITGDDKPLAYWGVYSMVERVDKKYVSNRFGPEGGSGNLYKADAWFEEGAADLAYYGEHIENYPKPRGEVAYGLRTNKDEPDYSDIINLCRVIDGVNYETPEDFAQAVEKVFNVDGFLRYTAVILSNLNLDTYPYTGNNYFIYHNSDTGKFEFISWDMNNSWGSFGGHTQFPIYGNVSHVGPLEYAPLFTKTFEVERYRGSYRAYLDLLNRHWFNYEYVSAQSKEWHDLIGPYVEQGTGDKMYYGPSALFSIENFYQDRMDLVSLTKQRSEFISYSLMQDQ